MHACMHASICLHSSEFVGACMCAHAADSELHALCRYVPANAFVSLSTHLPYVRLYERANTSDTCRRRRNETLRASRAPLHNSALPPSKSRLALPVNLSKGLLTQNAPSTESPLCSVLSLFAARRDHRGATATTRLPGREPRRDRQGVTARSQSLLSTVKTKRPTGKSRHCRASLASQTDSCASHSRLPVSRGQRPARRCQPAHGVRAQAPRPERPNCPSTHQGAEVPIRKAPSSASSTSSASRSDDASASLSKAFISNRARYNPAGQDACAQWRSRTNLWSKMWRSHSFSQPSV